MAASIDQHIAEWEGLVDKHLSHRDRLVATSPSLLPSDVRLALYGLTGNSLVTGLLTLKMLKTCLMSNRWWEVNVPYVPEHTKRQHQTDEFIMHSKMGTFVLFFSFYESAVRVMLRAILPGACNNAFDAFASVYACLFTHLHLKKHIPLLDFARTIRNLVHNNGVYFNKTGKDETLSFDGQPYIFQHGKPITFAFAELFFTIYERLLSVSDDLNAHPDIIGLPSTPTS